MSNTADARLPAPHQARLIELPLLIAMIPSPNFSWIASGLTGEAADHNQPCTDVVSAFAQELSRSLAA